MHLMHAYKSKYQKCVLCSTPERAINKTDTILFVRCKFGSQGAYLSLGSLDSGWPEDLSKDSPNVYENVALRSPRNFLPEK